MLSLLWRGGSRTGVVVAAVGRAVMVAVVRAMAEEVGMRRSFVGSVGRKGFFVHDADVKERLTRRVEIPEPSKKAKKKSKLFFLLVSCRIFKCQKATATHR